MKQAGWIQTYSGKKFWPLEPHSDDICIEDIAHALSLICRFGGHCKEFYSVGQHSIVGAQYLKRKGNIHAAYEFLFHDASETYLCDLTRPIKHASLLGSQYKKAEKKLQQAVASKFNFDFPNSKLVTQTDIRMLLTEKRDLLIHSDAEWVEKEDEYPCFKDKIVPWSPVETEQGFLRTYHSLSATLFKNTFV